MGQITEEPRDVVLTLRLTKKEHLQLKGQVDRAGYNSISRYIRERLLDGKRFIRSDNPLTGREVRDRLNSIGTDIAKYGSDYSRVAGELTDAMSEGLLNLSSRTASMYLGKLVNLSHSIKTELDQSVRLFQTIEQKVDTQSGNPVVIIKEKRQMLQKIEIIGNLVSDAELKSGNDGKQFIVFRVGVYENHGEERKSTYYDVSYPNGGIFNYLKKGRQVYVSGKLSISATLWNNAPYLNARISAKDIELIGSREA